MPFFVTTKRQIMIKYPLTKQQEVQDEYFGTKVADPFRWLEDDRSVETAAWVKSQNQVTQNYLAQIPFRKAIAERLSVLMDYEKFSRPFKEGDYIYHYKNTGLQNQSVLYRQKDGEEPELFLDPNTFSEDGTTSLAGISFSKDGSLAAYQTSAGGSDWTTVFVIDTASKKIVAEKIMDVKFSGLSWRGNHGFYYSSYNKPEEGSQLSGITEHHKLYYHSLGTPQVSDELVFGGSEYPRRYISGSLTEDERFLVITAANSTSGNALYLQDLSMANANIITLVDNFDHDHDFLHNEGGTLFIYTKLNAPNGKVVRVNCETPQAENWQDLIAETEHVLSPSTAGGKIFANYIKDATSMVLQYNLQGDFEYEIGLPGPGTAVGFEGKKNETNLYYTFTSYVYPATIFSYDLSSGTSALYRASGADFDSMAYESSQVFYPSKDGTMIPMIITHKKDLVLNGKNPTVIYGYGGFNVSLTPAFSTNMVILLEQGGVYAVANLRGGGEYGDAWHLAGTKMNKQNVFDDFIAGAEFLISSGYTSKELLASMGGSNGGLLVAATMVQRPDLFRVALPAVGVLDMLRYHKFTAGAGWAFDYGTAEESKEMFDYLYQYSPLHALKEGVAYPATLITTADHDDRVVPAHSFKFAAALQRAHQGASPVLIRIDTNAGHGAGKPTDKMIEEAADKLAFMFQEIGREYIGVR
jgi:prolyl oligopeptidase